MVFQFICTFVVWTTGYTEDTVLTRLLLLWAGYSYIYIYGRQCSGGEKFDEWIMSLRILFKAFKEEIAFCIRDTTWSCNINDEPDPLRLHVRVFEWVWKYKTLRWMSMYDHFNVVLKKSRWKCSGGMLAWCEKRLMHCFQLLCGFIGRNKSKFQEFEQIWRHGWCYS